MIESDIALPARVRISMTAFGVEFRRFDSDSSGGLRRVQPETTVTLEQGRSDDGREMDRGPPFGREQPWVPNLSGGDGRREGTGRWSPGSADRQREGEGAGLQRRTGSEIDCEIDCDQLIARVPGWRLI